MQTGGQLANFLRQRRNAIPSPALLGALTTGYKAAVERYAEMEGIPLIHFESGQRKDELVATYREPLPKRKGSLSSVLRKRKRMVSRRRNGTKGSWWALIIRASPSM